MTLKLSAWGEAIGISAVVLSLVFVGYELRQNSVATSLAAWNDFSIALSEYDQTMASDSILAPLAVKVSAGAIPEEFDDEEQFRIFLNFVSVLRLWEGLFQSVEQGVLPEEYLAIVGGGGAFDNPYFREIWPTRVRPIFTLGFTRFFEQLPWNNRKSPVDG